jgi:glycolate oxidase FAD binding subunit
VPPSEDLAVQRLTSLLDAPPAPVADDYRVDGPRPRFEVAPADEEQVCAVLALAAEHGWAVIPRGSGCRDRLGAALTRGDLVLSTRRLSGVVEHQPADLTVTVRAGTTLEELGEALGHHRQRLPLDPPEGGTVGGMVASAACGPRRLAYGGPRDLLLGLRAALSHGHAIRAGSKVVKNVAGYDLCKLFTGSMGTLGVLTEATFKVRPLPEASSTLALVFETSTAAARGATALLASELLPAALEVTNPALSARLGLPGPWALLVALEETPAGVDFQIERATELGRAAGMVARECLAADEESALWGKWRDWAAARASPLALRCAVAPARALPLVERVEQAAPLHLEGCALLASAGAGTGAVRLGLAPAVGGALADEKLLSFTERVASEARAAGGHAVVSRAPAAVKERVSVWGNGGDAWALMRAVRQRFDPGGVLSPERLFGGR